MEKERSKVWKYFTKVKGEMAAQCLKCPKKLLIKCSNTSGLVRHLDKIHNITLKSVNELEPSTSSCERDDDIIEIQLTQAKKSKSAVQTTLNYTKKKQETLGEIISRLAAKDGLSIRQITRSDFIRDSIQHKGFKLPSNESDVMKLILNYYAEKKQETIDSFRELRKLKDGQFQSARFSLSIDEWTSLRNRRYFNICVHHTGGKFYNLGLVLISGRCGANETREIIEKRLEEFGLIFVHDVVAVTSDGPNVMIKFGRESPTEMVLCNNHAIHLSVVATFCNDDGEKENVPSNSRMRVDHGQESESEESDDDDDCEDESDETTDMQMQYSQNIHKALKDTRVLVKLFRKSPLKNITLQKYVKEEMGHELNLILDVRTRWNSMMEMIERFLKLKNPLKKALIDLNMMSKWHEENISVLQLLLDVLSPVKLSVEALSRKDATILTSEAILNVLIQKLQSMETENSLAHRFLENLNTKIEGRRNVNLISLIKYLHDPLAYTSVNNISKTALISFTEGLYNRLFPSSSEATTECESETGDDEADSRSFDALLQKAIQKVDNAPVERSNSNAQITRNIIKKEFSILESTGKRTPNLENLFQALLTVKPTSTENERVFSLAGNIVTKIRNRLSDESINALVFLKAYFLR